MTNFTKNGRRYHCVCEGLSQREVKRFIREAVGSGEYRLGDVSHIETKDFYLPVAQVLSYQNPNVPGRLYFINEGDELLEEHHAHLMSLLSDCLQQ